MDLDEQASVSPPRAAAEDRAKTPLLGAHQNPAAGEFMDPEKCVRTSDMPDHEKHLLSTTEATGEMSEDEDPA